MSDWSALSWPVERLDEGLARLARRAGLAPHAAELGRPAPGTSALAVHAWLDAAARRLGIECDEQRLRIGDLERLLASAAPAVVAVPPASDDEPRDGRLVLAVGSSRRALLVLARDGRVRRLPLRELAERLAAPVLAPGEAGLERLLDEIGLQGAARARAAAALVREHFGDSLVGRAWRLSPAPGRSFARALAREGEWRRLAGVVVLHLAAYVLFLGAWTTLGRGALQGTLETGWIVAWALLLATIVPLRMLESWWQARFAVGASALLKRRLLAGAVRHRPDEVRHLGAGELLGRVLESEAVEALALSTVFVGIGAAVELALAGWVLAQGASGGLHVALLAAWVALAVALAVRHHRRVAAGTDARLAVSCDLVERLVGHRTRQAQQAPEHWHDAEDGLLERYLDEGRRLDLSAVATGGLLSTLWLPLALLGAAPAFAAGSTPGRLAVTVGGCLLAQQALSRLTSGVLQASSLIVAWRKVADLFRAAAREEPAGEPDLAAKRDERGAGGAGNEARAALEARGVAFRHAGRDRAVLSGCSLAVRDGDRVLLTGPSGGGKSTLAALLAGLREPDSGLVLLRGLDRGTWGAEAWRRSVACAPQYHENFVFTGPLAFNLLLGRGWPASPKDLAEAEEVCRALGLGDLIERMPAGLMQTVGETGWQLSHGERGRLYVARALLQGAEVVLFDESFAALDPESLRTSLECVRARAPALVAIAHP